MENKKTLHKTPVDEIEIFLCSGQCVVVRMQYTVYPTEMYQGTQPFFKYIATELIHNTEVRRVIALPHQDSTLSEKLSLVAKDISSHPEMLVNMFGII